MGKTIHFHTVQQVTPSLMVFNIRVKHQDMTGTKEVFNRVGYCLSIARYYSCREETKPQPRKSRSWIRHLLLRSFLWFLTQSAFR